MSLTLGRQGGIAKPLKKRTVGQTNIAHVYDGANYNDNYTDSYEFMFGFVAGNSEFRGQQTIQCYVGTQSGKADDGKTSIGEIKYTKLNKIGELTIYSPIES